MRRVIGALGPAAAAAATLMLLSAAGAWMLPAFGCSTALAPLHWGAKRCLRFKRQMQRAKRLD